jgi:hypothetical protein
VNQRKRIEGNAGTRGGTNWLPGIVLVPLAGVGASAVPDAPSAAEAAVAGAAVADAGAGGVAVADAPVAAAAAGVPVPDSS